MGVENCTMRVDCQRLCAQIKQEYQEVVLAAHQDPFFASHMYSNFGDLGMAVKVRDEGSSTICEMCTHPMCLLVLNTPCTTGAGG